MGGGEWGNKNLDVHSLFQGGGFLQIGRLWTEAVEGGVKKFAFFRERHKWMTPKMLLTSELKQKLKYYYRTKNYISKKVIFLIWDSVTRSIYIYIYIYIYLYIYIYVDS